MRQTIRSILFFLCLAILTGCTGLGNGPAQMSESRKISMADNYLKKAALHEEKNQLVEARDSYLLALTADPGNPKAAGALRSLNDKLLQQADKHYDKSRALIKKGKYTRARNQLRMALRFWPDHEKAKNALILEEQISNSNHLRHTVQKGETLSLISKMYYGTFDYAATIARTNHIEDATKIEVGMDLKIPELSHQPFINTQIPKPDSSLTQIKAIEPVISELNPVQMYKTLGVEFYEAGRYQNAIVEFKKVLHTAPDDRESIEYIAKSYSLLGAKARYSEKYLTAIEYYKKALQTDKDCLPCKKELEDLQGTFKETHYKTGMKYFDEEQLSLAIEEWTKVYQIDPEYKQTAEMLEKAKTIQKNINEIKKKQVDQNSN